MQSVNLNEIKAIDIVFGFPDSLPAKPGEITGELDQNGSPKPIPFAISFSCFRVQQPHGGRPDINERVTCHIEFPNMRFQAIQRNVFIGRHAVQSGFIDMWNGELSSIKDEAGCEYQLKVTIIHDGKVIGERSCSVVYPASA